MWLLLSVLLACLLLFFILRYLGLKRELGRLADAMRVIHGSRTNRQLVHLENNAYPMEQETLDVVALLGEELAALYPAFEAKGLPEVSLPETSAWTNADRHAVARVFGNLLQNMLKHGQQPMRIAGELDQTEIHFRFSNAAPGLSSQDGSQLFQRFFTVDRMRSGKSTGLGLSIAQAFLVQTQGTIEALL